MNSFHTSLYIEYFKNNLPKENSVILDIGCGGGKFLHFLYNSDNSYLLYGLDHSPEMIELSAKINHSAIQQGRLKLIAGPVTNIALEGSSLDLVTAFETIQFWPDTAQPLSEIYRLLKKGGRFLVINRYPKEGTKWWKIAKIKNDKEYISKLKNVGFGKIVVDMRFRNGWIIVEAEK